MALPPEGRLPSPCPHLMSRCPEYHVFSHGVKTREDGYAQALGGCRSKAPGPTISRGPFGVPLRAPALPAQASGCSPRTAGPQPRDVLRLALRPGGGVGRGAKPPSERHTVLPAERAYWGKP